MDQTSKMKIVNPPTSHGEEQTKPTHNPVTTTQVINSLGLLRIVVNETVPLDDYDRSSCPFCESNNPAAFNIYKKTSDDRARFHCFSCGARGDVFNFIQQTNKITFQEARHKISELMGRRVLPVGVLEDGQQTSHNSGLLDIKDKSCEADCPKYTALREDYNVILEQSYTDAGVEINSDLETVPALVNEITWLKERVKELEAQLKRQRKSSVRLDGFGTA